MDIEFASATRHLLSTLVKIIPEYPQLEPFRDVSLNNWRKYGSHNLLSSTKKSFRLQVNQREFGAALFADAQHLLNHATEHKAHTLSIGQSGLALSPSWTCVTLYYCALYLALAWTRIANNTILFLDKDAIAEFCRGAAQLPGAGTYRATLAVDDSTGEATLDLQKCNTSHFHEAVWIAVCAEVASLATSIKAQTASRKPSEDEILVLRAMALFQGLSFREPLAWPSKLRNAINYRPGFSYRNIVRHNFLKIESRLKRPALINFAAVVEFGEKAKRAVLGKGSPVDAPNDSMDLLIAQSAIIERLSEDALEEILVVRDAKCSARTMRQQYRKLHTEVNCLIGSIA